MRRYEPEFPHGHHEDCRALTELTLEHLPSGGSLGRARRYRRGTDVWQPDDRSDRLYFLQQGRVAVIAGDAEGHELMLQMVQEGKPFGELCFCGGPTKYRRTTARAETESIVVEIKLGDFMDYLLENRDVLAALVFTFCIRLGDAEQRLEVLAQRGAEERLGKLLLYLATPRGGESSQQRSAGKLSLSHNDLARMAAMSRQQVTLTLNKFRRHNLVRYERGSPLIVDAAALAAYLANTRPGKV